MPACREAAKLARLKLESGKRGSKPPTTFSCPTKGEDVQLVGGVCVAKSCDKNGR